MTLKLIKNKGILTNGSGSRRAVMEYGANLIYQYDDPERIVGVFTGEVWEILTQPYYSSGGWGSGSSGDGDGSYLVEHARELVNAIDGEYVTIDLPAFISGDELKDIQLKIKKIKKLEKAANDKGLDVNVEYPGFTGEIVSNRFGYNYATKTGKGNDVLETLEKYNNAVQVFITGKGKTIKIDEYVIRKNSIKCNNTVVAFRKNNKVFMNSQVLPLTSFERNFLGKQSIVQVAVRKIVDYSIPLNVLEAAKLKLDETVILQNGPESDHIIKGVDRHFTGALLLENNGHKFFMDIDRIEIKHSLFNVFFVEVDKKVKTIEQAYNAMKPDAVKDAEAKGIEVKRQGEWFFIKTDKMLEVKDDNIRSWLTDEDKSELADKEEIAIFRAQLRHKDGRPNDLFRPFNSNGLDDLVCGPVSHSGREHHTISLGMFKDKEEIATINPKYGYGNEYKEDGKTKFQLWTVVPNTTVANFTIEGDVD